MTSRPTLQTDDRGTGPIMVFVHGYLNDASIWAGVIDELESDFRCIAIDLPGHGRSEATGPGTYGRNFVLAAIRRVLDHADVGPAILVGHSLGGYLALALAIEDPHRVVGLGLVGAGPGFRNPVSRQKWNDSVHAISVDRNIPAGLEEISSHVDAMVLDRMDEITVPVTVVVGERDKGFEASAAVFDKHLNVSAHTIIPDAGHMVHYKAPVAVAAALRAGFSG